MDEIDHIFARLRDEPVPPRLAAIDAAVLDAVTRAGPAFASPSRAASLAGAIALVVGIAGAALPSVSAPDETRALTDPDLTPSALLLGDAP